MDPQQISQFIQKSRQDGVSDIDIARFLEGKGVNIGLPDGLRETVRPSSFATPLDQMDSENEKKVGFFGKVAQSWRKRTENVSGAYARQFTGQQTPFETGVQLLGQTAGGALDTIGAGITSALGVAGRGVSAVTPDFIEDPIKQGAGALARSEPVQMGLEKLAEGVDAYQAWAQENPRAAANTESVANTAFAALVAKNLVARQATQGATVLGKTGESIKAKGTEQVRNVNMSEAMRLVQPELTKKVRVDEAGRLIEGGFLKSRTLAPTKAETAMAKVVAEVPGFSSKNTALKNYALVNTHTTGMAKQLESQLGALKITFPMKEHTAFIKKDMKDRLSNAVFMKNKDVAKEVDGMINMYLKIAAQHANTPKGVLEARKAFDVAIKKWKGPAALEQTDRATNVLKEVSREVRQSANTFLANKAGSIPVKESLKHQSTLYRAMDEIGKKVGAEAMSTLERSTAALVNVLTVRGRLNQTAALLTGMGGLGAAALAGPYVSAGIGSVVLGASGIKMLVSPSAKIQFGNFLLATEHILQKAGVLNLKTAEVSAILAARDQVQEYYDSMQTEASYDDGEIITP